MNHLKVQLRKASGCIISQIADAGSSTKKQLHTSEWYYKADLFFRQLEGSKYMLIT